MKKKDNDKIKKVGPNVERLCSDTSFIYLGFSNVAFDQLVGHLNIFYCFDI